MVNPIPKKMESEDDRLIAEYLEKGGKISQVKYGQVSDDADIIKNMWGRGPRKKTNAPEDQSE